MKKISQSMYFGLSVFFCLVILFSFIPKVAEAASLNFGLTPWNGEIRPGGAILIGANSIFDADETTIEAWINPKSYPTGVGEDEGRTILWNGDGTGGHDPYWILLNTSGRLEARVDYESPYQQHIFVSSDPIELNTWHHFALVIGTDSTSLYIDGIKQPGTFLGGGSVCKGTNYLAMGRSMWHWNPYEGLIDDMRIWKTARTEAEIQEDRWTKSVSGDNPDLIAYWDFEQGGDSRVLYDLTSNHINGEIQGCTWTAESAPDTPEPLLNPNNNHYYEVIDVVGSGEQCVLWQEADNIADASSYKGLPGHLATITSQAENNWLVQNFNLSDKWIGGFQDVNSPGYSEPSGGWKWITGEEWNYTNWLSGEPNNFGGDERHLNYYFSNKWADKSSCARGYVIEYEPAIPSCNADIWSCGEWSACSASGTQNRTCAKTFDCLTADTPSPETSQSCSYTPPICTSWTYSNWSVCQPNSTQTRNIISSAPIGCIGGNPVLTQNCNYASSCVTDVWSCGEWGSCSTNGNQNRNCVKTFDCSNAQTASPTTQQYCSSSNKPTNQQPVVNNEAVIEQLKLQIADLQKQIMALLTEMVNILKGRLNNR